MPKKISTCRFERHHQSLTGNDNTSIDNEYCHLGARWPWLMGFDVWLMGFDVSSDLWEVGIIIHFTVNCLGRFPDWWGMIWFYQKASNYITAVAWKVGSFQTNGSGSKITQNSWQVRSRRFLLTLILILFPPKSIKISRQIYQISIALCHFRMLVTPFPHFQHGQVAIGHVYHTAGMPPRSRTLSPFGAQREASREINGVSQRTCNWTVRSTLPRDPSLTESSKPQLQRLLCGWQVRN